VGIIVIAVVVLFAVFYDFSTTGEAIHKTPPTDPLNLDSEKTEGVHTPSVSAWKIKVKLSKDDKPQIISVNTNLIKGSKAAPEIIQYDLKTAQDKQLVVGLVGKNFAGDSLYLDDDAIPDLGVNFKDGVLSFTNLNFIEPDASNITLFTKDKVQINDDTLYVEKDAVVDYLVNVTALKVPPKVNATWGDGSKLSATDFVLVNGTLKIDGKDTNFSTWRFNWTPTESKAYSLTINANVQNKITQRKITFAVGDIVFAKTETGFPTILMRSNNVKFIPGKPAPEKDNVTYTFTKTESLQPFSLLCGEATINPLDTNISEVYSWKDGVQKWKKNSPSGFSKFEVNKGYLVRLAKDKTLTLFQKCEKPKAGSPPKTVPTVKTGWNLVSVAGYKAWSVDDLEPSSAIILEIYQITNSGVDLTTDIKELEPGKVYWVRVK